jgi:hyaluronoglucosaminidase
VNLTTRKAGPPIPVGPGPRAIVAAPDGATVYVADDGSAAVTTIDTAHGTPGRPISVGLDPRAIAMAPGAAPLTC